MSKKIYRCDEGKSCPECVGRNMCDKYRIDQTPSGRQQPKKPDYFSEGNTSRDGFFEIPLNE